MKALGVVVLRPMKMWPPKSAWLLSYSTSPALMLDEPVARTAPPVWDWLAEKTVESSSIMPPMAAMAPPP